MLFGALLLIQILALSLTSCVTMGELYNMANCCKMAQESPSLYPCPLKNALLSRGRFYLPDPPGLGLALWPALTNKYGRSDTVLVSRLDLGSPWMLHSSPRNVTTTMWATLGLPVKWWEMTWSPQSPQYPQTKGLKWEWGHDGLPTPSEPAAEHRHMNKAG